MEQRLSEEAQTREMVAFCQNRQQSFMTTHTNLIRTALKDPFTPNSISSQLNWFVQSNMEDNEDKTLIHWQFTFWKCAQVVPTSVSA